MNRAPSFRGLRVFALVALLAATLGSHAQVAHVAPRGEVSGVDLQIDGALKAYRGHPMRFGFTTFEVLGLDRLRRARGTTVRVFGSFSRERALAEISTDVQGRGLATIDIPADAPVAFTVVIEARSPNRVSRRFEFSVPVEDPRTLEVMSTPSVIYPGSPMHVAGRLTDNLSRRAVAGAEVTVEVRGPRGPVGTALRVTTDANGTFRRDLVVPSDAPVGTYSVAARVGGEHSLSASASTHVTTRQAPALLVSLAPSERIVRPRQIFDVDVVVRRPDGRPVPGATVTTMIREDERATGTTDARGRVRLRYRSQTSGGALTDERISVAVERAGVGSANGSATVRVTGNSYAGRISFEGGRFATALGGRVYVRVVGADGRPVNHSVPVNISGPRVRGGEVHAVTDAFGVAMAEVQIGPVPSGEQEGTDSCGATVATEITAYIGEGSGAASLQRCLPIDSDGVLRVRVAHPDIRSGTAFPVHVDRASSLGRQPVVLELVDTRSGNFGAVLASTTLAGDAQEGTLTVPADRSGDLWVRARVLQGGDALELRGASTLVHASPSASFTIDGRFDRERSSVSVSFDGTPSSPVSLYAVALPYEQAIAAQRGYDPMAQYVGPSPANADTYPRGESWLVASLADEVPYDDIAANAMLEGAVTPQPGPESPEQLGRLRDPYRLRARFVAGRLALLFRALESFVDQNVPGDESTVAHDRNGHREFNDAVLSAVASDGELGPEGATGLGGEPITIAQLRSIDSSFGYDAVARRVTRKRLFKLLLEMRAFVRNQEFDLAWARPGDPRVWLERMVTEGGGNYVSLEPRAMVDGWGRPFQLVPVARPRFEMLQPVVGYEIVSAGPDGRYGNGDDVFDPTARVLPMGSTYAAAVAEDSLVARLRGVELSRASLGQVAELFGVYAGDVPYGDDASSMIGSSSVSPAFPPIVEVDADPLAIRRYGEIVPSLVAGPVVRSEGDATFQLDLGTEPRSWGVFVYAVSDSGDIVSTMVRATSGTSALTHGALPMRLHTNEPLAVDVAVTNVSSSARTYSLRETTCDGATLSAPESLAVGAEESQSVRLTLRARSVGRCPVRLDVVEGDRVLASIAREVDVTSGLHPQRRRVSDLVAGSASLDVAAPAGASRVSGRVTVVDPGSIVELPELAGLHDTNPSLIAWARVTAGRGFDDALRNEVLRSFDNPSRSPSSLERALAVVALSQRVDDDDARVLRDSLLSSLSGSSSDSVEGSDGTSAHRRMVSAVVASLALSGVPDPDDSGSDDAIARLFRRLLPELRASVRADVASPTELAFPAAALLLTDSHDGHGRALFERAFATVQRAGDMLRLEAAPGRERIEGTAATLALAIAAHELGRQSDAHALVRSATRELAAIGRGAADAPFWLAALGVYGALANETVAECEIDVGGHTSHVRLESGREVVPFAIDAGSRTSVRVRSVAGAFLLAEAEVAYEAPFEADTRGPLTLALEGDVGRAYGVAALELTVGTTEAVFDPIVELELPVAVELDAVLESAIRSSGVVRDVELRRGGFVRMRLAPMGPNATARISLPLAFRAAGSLTGLAASAYPATQSYRRTVMAPRPIQLAAE